MVTLDVSKRFAWQGRITPKVARLCRMFGLTADGLAERCIEHACRLELRDGDIVYITGPSGSGKSVLLRELIAAVPAEDRIDLRDIELPDDRAVIDCIEGDLIAALRTLTAAGLGDVFAMLNQPANLSAGQQYRFRLAVALAAPAKYIFADEFCSELDRISAAVASYNLRKFATRTARVFILASAHEDILRDLAPDVLIVKELTGTTEIIYKESARPARCSVKAASASREA